jgi:hypothetical protein
MDALPAPPVQPMDAQPENTGRNPDGTFAKGNAVNLASKPKGARNKATLLAEALLDGQAQGLCQSASNFDHQPWLSKLLNRNGNPAYSWGHGWTPIKFTRRRKFSCYAPTVTY